MGEYIGLDVSMKDTAISVRRDGLRVWRGKCASDPETIARMVRKHAREPERVIFETGPLSVWFYHALRPEGLRAICVDARHAKAALDMAANKTDANDADGLAHLAEVGFYREDRVKGFDSMLTRTLIAASDDLHDEVQIAGFVHELEAVVGTICGEMLDPGPASADAINDGLGARCPKYLQWSGGPSATFHRYRRRCVVAPDNLLSGVESALLRRGRLNRLVVDHRRARTGLSPLALAIEHQFDVVDRLKQEPACQFPKPAIDRLPGAKMDQ